MEKASIRCCMLEKSGFKVLRSALGSSTPLFRHHFHFIPEVIMVIVNTDTYRIFRTRLSLGRRSFEVAGLTKRLLLQELRGWYFSWLSPLRLSWFHPPNKSCILWIFILMACLGHVCLGKGLKSLSHVEEERLQGVEVAHEVLRFSSFETSFFLFSGSSW